MNRQILCCGLEPIKNTALGKEFLYCRECKKEVCQDTEVKEVLESYRWNESLGTYEYFNNRGETNE